VSPSKRKKIFKSLKDSICRNEYFRIDFRNSIDVKQDL